MTRRRCAAILAALLAAAAAGCGQQGPLMLPGDARPIERIDPLPAEPENDDERERER